MDTHHLAQIDFNTLQKVASPKFDVGSSLANLISGGSGGAASLIDLLFFGAGTLALLYLIYGGITYMLSKGDPKAVSAAQGRLTYAIGGLIVVFCAYWIVQLAKTFFGFTDFGI